MQVSRGGSPQYLSYIQEGRGSHCEGSFEVELGVKNGYLIISNQ